MPINRWILTKYTKIGHGFLFTFFTVHPCIDVALPTAYANFSKHHFFAWVPLLYFQRHELDPSISIIWKEFSLFFVILWKTKSCWCFLAIIWQIKNPLKTNYFIYAFNNPSNKIYYCSKPQNVQVAIKEK